MAFDPINGLKSFYSEAKHVMSVAYRPDTNTFKRTLKIVLLGILILGVMGYILYSIIHYLTPGVPT